MAYVSPAYNAVDFVAGSSPYTAPTYDAVDFTAPSDVPLKTLNGNGALRGISGAGVVTGGGKVRSLSGVGRLRGISANGLAVNQRVIVGNGSISIKGFGSSLSNVAHGDGAIAIRGIGLAGDHACGQ